MAWLAGQPGALRRGGTGARPVAGLPETGPQRRRQAAVGVEARHRVAARRSQHRSEAELAGLGDAALGVRDVAQLAGEADLAEAGQRPALGAHRERLAALG